MKLTQLVAVGLAVLLVGAGAAAAVPSQADDDAQNADDRADAMSAEDAEDAEEAANETADNESDEYEEERAGPPADVGPSADAGPPTDMPAQVPEHVIAIHERINAFLNDDLADLGSAVSEVVGGDDAEASDDESGNADAAPA